MALLIQQKKKSVAAWRVVYVMRAARRLVMWVRCKGELSCIAYELLSLPSPSPLHAAHEGDCTVTRCGTHMVTQVQLQAKLCRQLSNADALKRSQRSSGRTQASHTTDARHTRTCNTQVYKFLCSQMVNVCSGQFTATFVLGVIRSPLAATGCLGTQNAQGRRQRGGGIGCLRRQNPLFSLVLVPGLTALAIEPDTVNKYIT
jgi:hypothetical protein